MVILGTDYYQKGSTSYYSEGKNEELIATEETERIIGERRSGLRVYYRGCSGEKISK